MKRCNLLTYCPFCRGQLGQQKSGVRVSQNIGIFLFYPANIGLAVLPTRLKETKVPIQGEKKIVNVMSSFIQF